MFRNYVKTAIRNFIRNAGISSINIGGLALGLACTIIIFVYVHKEFSYDRFHRDYERIFRVTTIDEALGVSSNNVGITNPVMTLAAERELSEVTASTRLFNQGNVRILNEDHETFANDAKLVEPSFLSFFDYKFAEGTDTARFNSPRKVIMTESLAEKTFPKGDPIGKIVEIDEEDWEVVGLLKDDYGNSHMKLDLLMSMYPTQADSSFANYLDSWNGLGMIGYIKLANPNKSAQVQEKLNELSHANEVPEYWVTKIQPLSEVHLGSSQIIFDGNNVDKGDITYIYVLSAIAVFILIIAAFNFMNLATALATTRAREVGVRKVMGAERSSFIVQFLLESTLITLLAFVLAILLIMLASPMLELGMDGTIISYLSRHLEVLVPIILLVPIVGVLSGIYPSLVLSSYKSSRVLKGSFRNSKKGVGVRKALVIFQFIASISLIASTLLINAQLNYLRQKDLGFSSSSVVNIQLTENAQVEKLLTFRDELRRQEGIKEASISSNMPGRTFGRTGVTPEGLPEEEENWIVSVLSMDEFYLETMGMQLASGRNFSSEFGSEQQNSVIVNQAFVDQVGWEEPVGKKVGMGGDQERTVVGVVEDFHFVSMRHLIEPLIIMYNPDRNGNISIKINGDINKGLALIEDKWETIYPEYSFNYQFFDEEFGALFESDEKFSKLVLTFTILAILIACMGLFGLSTYVAQQRRKEIGVRKVLGSGIRQVVFLLIKEFIILIVIAALLAIPLSYLVMDKWLTDFPYRIDLTSISSLLFFAAAGIVALLIGILTVSFQSLKASMANPADTLRVD